MQELLRQFNETINLAIVVDGYVVYVEMFEANRSLRMQARIGDRHPLHSTALGKAILAFLPEEERKPFETAPLDYITTRTVTDRRTLAKQTKDIRRLGYATEIGENERRLDVHRSADIRRALLPDRGIELSAPERRMNPVLTGEAIASLCKAAQAISTELGYDRAEVDV